MKFHNATPISATYLSQPSEARAYHERSEARSGRFHAFFAACVCGCARRTLSSSQRGAERIGAIETILIPLLDFLPLCDRWHYDGTYFSKIILKDSKMSV